MSPEEIREAEAEMRLDIGRGFRAMLAREFSSVSVNEFGRRNDAFCRVRRRGSDDV
jgi:hypothetical protein